MATYDYNSVVLTGRQTPERVAASFVSAGFFDVLRVPALKGPHLSARCAVAAFFATRALSGMLFGVNPRDPAVFLVVALCLLCAVVFASYIPARRAAGVDPLAALRHE